MEGRSEPAEVARLAPDASDEVSSRLPLPAYQNVKRAPNCTRRGLKAPFALP